MYKPNTATLLITFNRPVYTEAVLNRLRELRIPKLYVFNDGPRPGNARDQQAHDEILKLIEAIDWECDLHTLISDKNMGCGFGVSGAISWAFEHENELIILEDDCVPSPAFFPYCDQLLERYRNDQRVWMVCGENHDYPESAFLNSDYIFSQFGFNWGWATWKRCWESFDIYMKELPAFKAGNLIESVFTHPAISQTYKRMYEKLRYDQTRPQFWTAQFGFQIIAHRGYFIIPGSNLISNIGESGDHTIEASKYVHVPTDDNFIVTRHPTFVLHDNRIDLMQFNRRIKPMIDGKPLHQKVMRRITKIRDLIGSKRKY